MSVKTTSSVSSLPPKIPSSTSIVSISIIDSTAWLSNLPSSFLLKPIHSFTAPYWSGPSLSFLIRHPTQGSLLFDLGVRKDWSTSLPIAKMVIEHGWKLNVEKDAADILVENGVKLEGIHEIIVSHHHFDHMGNPALFPPSTRLVVGPGFKGKYLPGDQTDPFETILESDYAGRELQEIDFNNDDRACSVGGFRALDWFRDGSFYLLDSPGHTVGHICGLARTSPSNSVGEGSFMLLGGDAAHHSGEHRPSPCHLLPDAFSAAHPEPPLSKSAPFYQGAFSHSEEESDQSIQKLMDLEADERVWVVIAHDPSLAEAGVDFFPKEANHWKAKGWKEKTLWNFLEDGKA